MRAPFSRGGAVGRVGGLVLPVGLIGGPVGGVVKCAEQVGAARLELELGGDVAVRLPLKLSVRCEPLATARAAALRAAATFEGRPPSFPASRGSIARRKPKSRTPFRGACQRRVRSAFFGWAKVPYAFLTSAEDGTYMKNPKPPHPSSTLFDACVWHGLD